MAVWRFATENLEEVAMDRGELNVIQMLIVRIVSAIALFAIVASPARAADQTTAFWNDGHSSSLSDEELMRYALASPGPPFPEEAQKAKTTGSGLYELRINRSGVTTEVVIVKSSGSVVLDRAAKNAFMKWRFKPGIFARVRVPVSWSVNRVR
jgi:TonB family protein